MKRAREDFEAPDIITEPLASPFRRARGQIVPAPKKPTLDTTCAATRLLS